MNDIFEYFSSTHRSELLLKIQLKVKLPILLNLIGAVTK